MQIRATIEVLDDEGSLETALDELIEDAFQVERSGGAPPRRQIDDG